MNRYKIVGSLGDGTYGSVLKAINEKGDVVAVRFSLPLYCLVDSF